MDLTSKNEMEVCTVIENEAASLTTHPAHIGARVASSLAEVFQLSIEDTVLKCTEKPGPGAEVQTCRPTLSPSKNTCHRQAFDLLT